MEIPQLRRGERISGGAPAPRDEHAPVRQERRGVVGAREQSRIVQRRRRACHEVDELRRGDHGARASDAADDEHGSVRQDCGGVARAGRSQRR